MFKVECPGCKAPYQVDERRVPKTGLKMRCPKCGTSFKVDSPGEPLAPAAPVLGAALGLTGDESSARSRLAGAGLKSTMLGVAAPAGLLDAPLTSPARQPPPPAIPSGKPAGSTADASAEPSAGNAPRPAPARPAPARPAPPARAPARPVADRPAPPVRPAAPRPQAAPPVAPARPPPRTRPEPPPHDPYAEAELPVLGQAAPRAPRVAPPKPIEARTHSPLEFELASEPPPASSPALESSADSMDDLPALPLNLADAPRARDELDLPALPQRAPASGVAALDFDMDLPAVPRPKRASPAPVDDLPAVPKPRDAMPLATDVDLPELASGAAGLPAVPVRGADLPSVAASRGASGETTGSFELELPTPSAERSGGFDDADMPVLSLDAVLPSPVGGSNLPSVLDALPLVADPLPTAVDALPRVADAMPTALDAFPLAVDGPPSRRAPSIDAEGADAFSLDSVPPLDDGTGFGELELPLGSDPFAGPASTGDLRKVDPGGREFPEPDFAEGPPSGDPSSAAGGEFDAFALESTAPQRPQPRARAVERQTGGGVAFGEVNLGGDELPAADVALEDVRPHQVSHSDEDMEFGAIPQEEAAPQNAVTAGASQVRMDVGVLPPEPARKSKKAARIGLGALVVVCVGGGALALVPDVGPFGYHLALDTLKSGEYREVTDRAVRDSRKLLAQDTFSAATRGVEQVEQLRKQFSRVRPLAAYAAFTGFLQELRFGPDSKAHARATVSLDSLAEAGEVEHLALAKAAREAVEGKPAVARRLLKALVANSRTNIDAWITLAELELKAGDAKAARTAWESAKKLEDSPRTSFGLARTLLLADDADGAEATARATLAKAPAHTGAKLLIARVAWERDATDETIQLVRGVVDAKPALLSPQELVLAHTLLGNIYLTRGRVGLAEAAFTTALKADPKAASALTGLGTALYQSARYSEALARFEAAAQADPQEVAAKIGMVKCRLVLERVKEASELAQTLREAHPKSAEAALWHGRALEALGQREEAESAYRRAVELAPKDASRVEPYVALSMLLNQLGKLAEAQALLDHARSELPDSPAIHRAMGDVALAQGRYDDALSEFNLALKLDPSDLRAQFQLGVTLRRANRLDEAQAAFDRVAAVDKEYPGLALERGLLHEVAGRADEALKAYEAALAKAPDDLDLMLRVGCSNATAGRAKEAEALLRKVLAQRPNSAETNHCMGRALLLDPTRLADAQRSLERAVTIDPNRADYHLYVGWAANEARNFTKASQELEKALSLDQSLADAYWQRGVLLARQGAVKDAIVDLQKALQLRPSRHEAHAALADVYYDLGREAEALSEWQKAVSAIPNQPVWRFRYGKLLLANRQVAAAETQLKEALAQIAQTGTEPLWVPEAHLLLAQALGDQPAAVEHWEAFLKQGPRNSPYRADAKAALRRLGKRWSGD